MKPIEVIWILTRDNREVVEWIENNLTDTTYCEGVHATIVSLNSEADRMLFKLRWT